MIGSFAISLVNSALEGFVGAAALKMPRGIRINVVSPNWVTDTLKAFNMAPAIGTPVEVVAHSYVEALEGSMNCQALDVIRWTHGGAVTRTSPACIIQPEGH